MNVLLSNESLPHTGTFEIRRTITVNLTAQEARRRAHRWLLLEVSHMMGASDPTLVVDSTTLWRVPVHLSTPQHGIVGQVGFVDISAINGEFINIMQQKALIEQQAQILMTSQPVFQPKQLLQKERITDQVSPAPKLILDENGLPIVISDG